MATATNIHGFNIGGNNNSFDQRGHFYRAFLNGNVSGMLVKQNSTPNMTVLVEHGSALLNKNSISASIAEIKSDTSVTIDTANTANPRIDTIVIYEDTSVAIPTAEASYWQDGAGGRFKIVSLPGTAAASPVALSDATVQTTIGAGKPWTRLANITVPANSTTIVNSNIADNRSQLSSILAPNSVKAQNVDFTTFPAAIQSNGTSIALPAGKTYFVIHTVNVEQVNAASASVFIYNITGMPSTTWTAKASGQASWDRPANMGIINGGVTVSRTSSTSTNVNVSGERFVAIPLFQSAP